MMEPITDVQCRLGEAPLWHFPSQRLFWFDILNRRVHSCAEDGTEVRSWDLPVAATAAMIGSDNDLVVATDRGVERFDISSGELSMIAEVEADNPSTRSNDGRGGPDGIFYVSTMGWYAETGMGSIYAVGSDRSVARLLGGLTIPNSLAFSSDGRRMYHTDSPTRTLRYSESGTPASNDPILHDLRAHEYVSDGTTVDSEDHLWTCHWDGGEVVRIHPDGTVVDRLTIPTGRPTRACLGGSDLRTLFVTTAIGDLADEPNTDVFAGRLFSTRVRVAGIFEPTFGTPAA